VTLHNLGVKGDRCGGASVTDQGSNERNAADPLQPTAAAERVAECNGVHVCDATQQTIDDLIAGCEAMRIRLAGEGAPLLFVVDFLQREVLTCDPALARLGYGEISSKLADFAKDKGVAVIALSQLTRAAEKGRPSMASLRESGSIEQDAAWILALDRQSDEHHSALDLYLLKNRYGPMTPWCVQLEAKWAAQTFVQVPDAVGPWDLGGF